MRVGHFVVQSCIAMVISRPPHSVNFLEPLEDRIAPAVIINVGAPTDGAGNTTYNEAPFVQASLSADPGIADLFEGSSDHYVLTLGAGDKVKMFNQATGYGDYLTISAGKVLAFFHNKDASTEFSTSSLLDDGRVDKNDFVGLSLGTGARITLFGAGVDGDIVSNFNSSTGLISQNALVAGNTIAGLSISGGVNGRIIAPGNVSNISIGVGVEQITTSSNGAYTYDFGGSANSGPGEALLAAYTPDPGKAAGNIAQVVVGNLDQIVGGAGGSGGKGGAITGVTVKADYDGFDILAGAGGNGSPGGAGGAVTSVLVVGFESPSAAVPVSGEIMIAGGQGGIGSAGAGGAGGAVSKIFVGYSQLNTNSVSPLPLAYSVGVSGGDGGQGTSAGGAGGSLADVNVHTSVNGDPLKDEIYFAGGNGGEALTGQGRGGSGGSISKVLAFNINDNPLSSDNIVIRAGDAGTSLGAGSAGGGVSAATALAEEIEILAGAGSSGGTTGGAGGRIGNITLSFSPTDRPEVLQIAGGTGGQGGSGAGGRGGAVDQVSGLFLDFSGGIAATDSAVVAGSGGKSLQGVGGQGGSLSTIRLFEPQPDNLDSSTGVPSTHEKIAFQAGAGGDGLRGGGLGGAVTGLTFFGYNTLPTINAGNGGSASATGQGPGGAGGTVGNVAVQVFNLSAARPGDRVLVAQAGNGGAAAGTASGGAGGSISSATVFASIGSDRFQPVYPVEAHVHLLAGQGGASGAGGGVGAGGSVATATVSTASGNLNVVAGSAGSAGTGVRGASGGSLTNVSASASGDVNLEAGDGRLGGAGGRINSAAWFGINAATNQPDDDFAPGGSVEIQGGQGSVGVGTAPKAGAGGSLSRLGGYAGDTGVTQIYAGDGNGSVAGGRAAPGGSVSNINLFGGLGVVDLRAGNGGSLTSGSAGTGGAGGSVSGINGVAGVNFLVVAAGDGGDAGTAGGKGGNGGNVSSLNIFGDIGRREGSAFGIDGMGGVFAGAGGLTAGADTQLNGKAGNVTNITAAAISSIVAGRPTTVAPENFQLVSLVDRVYLRGLTAPEVNASGGFTNFGTANLVGGVATEEPSAAGSNVFKVSTGAVTSNPYAWELGTTEALDGLVAATTLTNNRNFRPQAWLAPAPLTVSPTGWALVDYRNDFNFNPLTGTSS